MRQTRAICAVGDGTRNTRTVYKEIVLSLIASVAHELRCVEGKGLAEDIVGTVVATQVLGVTSDALGLEVKVTRNAGTRAIDQLHVFEGGTVSANSPIYGVTLITHKIRAGFA